MRRKNRKLLILLVAILAGIVAVHSAPTATKRGRRRSPLELVQQRNMITLPFSFGQENIPVKIEAAARERPVLFTQTVDLSSIDPKRGNVQWSRLVFDPERTVLRMDLFGRRGAGENQSGDILKITNLLDGSVQWLNAYTLKQWNFRSAFFNGGKLKVELLGNPVLPIPQNVSIVVSSVVVNHERGNVADPIVLPPPASMCSAADPRKASTDARVARLFPVGCTAFTINDRAGCLLTAGHCFDGVDAAEQVLQSNVPLSSVVTVQGTKLAFSRHPPPQFQYPVDPASVQYALTFADNDSDPLEGTEDWAYFGTRANPNTGLKFRDAAGGQAFTLAAVDEATGLIKDGQGVKVGATITMTGYGIVRDANRKQLEQVQQSSNGKLVAFEGAEHVTHRIDCEAGSSGSPLIVGDVAIGIQTNGGCNVGDARSANYGSTVAMRGLREALAKPKSVCTG
ncbi:hypothetical protein H9P43_006746 [Blastocladiella emersonii ATCC 22665]|nr:hypothetical protein H9P43_006746 [Blastocladiella emersonii ATCC 22665]